MKNRKIYRLAALILLAAALLCTTAFAEFDVTQYSYEELQEIKRQAEERMAELEREYALEHADRAIAFEAEEQVVFPKNTIQVQPVVTALTPDAPATTKFVWSSSNPEIATVAQNGTVTAKGRGDTVITATAADNEYLSASYILHAIVPVEKITVWGPEGPLYLSAREETATFQLGFSVEPEDAYFQQVNWASSDETIATVDENGFVQGLKPGKVTLTATSTEQVPAGKRPVRATYDVVIRQAVTALEMEPATLALNAGEKAALAVTIVPENAQNKQVIYTSSDPEIAKVDANGTVTALACGECDIICEAADGQGASVSRHVKVSKLVTRVSLAEAKIVLPVGGTYPITVTVEPEDATDPGLIWTSSNVFVARVAGGRVEVVGQGDCEITCTTVDGTNITASVRVHVPTFTVEATEYVVTDRQGLVIPVIRIQEGCEILVNGGSDSFRTEWTEAGLKILPESAGTGTIALSNPEAAEDTVWITITVENSAVFNQASYPPISYMELVRVPEMYEGAQISIYGKVLHVSGEEDGVYAFMVGTAGEKYTDQVIQVQCAPELLPAELNGGEMLTVYGLFHLDHAYSEVLQAETMVPGMNAEKIVMK